MPAAANSLSVQSPSSLPLFVHRALRVFYQQLAQRRDIQHRFFQQLLQLGVFIRQRLQSLGLGNLHAAVFRAPRIERRVADAMLAVKISRRCTSLVLLQHRDDLLFGKPRLTDSTSNREHPQG
jgi:hypothetical protein